MDKFVSTKYSDLSSEPTFVGAIGKEDSWSLESRLAEKILVDNMSIQLLMGNIADSALRLNAGAEAAKSISRDNKKSSKGTWEQQLLWQLSQQLDQINQLIEAIEEQIELLRLEAKAHREEALQLFERADTLEDLLADGLQEHERRQAIAILRQSGHTEDLDAFNLSEIAALLTLQLQTDRANATTSYQKGEDCDSAADALEKELAERRREAEDLRKELEALSNDSQQSERLAQACLRLKEDLVAIAPDSAYTASLTKEVAQQKHQSATEERYDFDVEEELKALDLNSVNPAQRF